MWNCPKCRREFKNINQEHSCGELPKRLQKLPHGAMKPGITTEIEVIN